MFDYKGYTEQELLELVDDKKAQKEFPVKYWTSELYAFGKCYRGFANNFPENLPLYVTSKHGSFCTLKSGSSDVDNNSYAMFVFSQKHKEEFEKVSKKPCYKVMMPYAWYRRENKIEKAENAKGTLVFPAHSTPNVLVTFDVEKYVQQLRELPEDMQPFCVCLHLCDIKNGNYKKYLELGVPVYTAGASSDYKFVDRYYDILKNFKYATSNEIGSYTHYAVEMGIPFSLMGEQFYEEVIDEKMEEIDVNTYTDDCLEAHKKAFDGIHKEITQEQRELVEYYMGLNDHISRDEMAKILWDAYNKRRKNPLNWICEVVKIWPKITLTFFGVLKISFKKK